MTYVYIYTIHIYMRIQGFPIRVSSGDSVHADDPLPSRVCVYIYIHIHVHIYVYVIVYIYVYTCIIYSSALLQNVVVFFAMSHVLNFKNLDELHVKMCEISAFQKNVQEKPLYTKSIIGFREYYTYICTYIYRCIHIYIYIYI